jgi:hypothetical protein
MCIYNKTPWTCVLMHRRLAKSVARRERVGPGLGQTHQHNNNSPSLSLSLLGSRVKSSRVCRLCTTKHQHMYKHSTQHIAQHTEYNDFKCFQ